MRPARITPPKPSTPPQRPRAHVAPDVLRYMNEYEPRHQFRQVTREHSGDVSTTQSGLIVRDRRSSRNLG